VSPSLSLINRLQDLLVEYFADMHQKIGLTISPGETVAATQTAAAVLEQLLPEGSRLVQARLKGTELNQLLLGVVLA